MGVRQFRSYCGLVGNSIDQLVQTARGAALKCLDRDFATSFLGKHEPYCFQLQGIQSWGCRQETETAKEAQETLQCTEAPRIGSEQDLSPGGSTRLSNL